MDNYYSCFKDKEAKEPVNGIKVRSAFLDNTMMTYMEFEANSKIPMHKHPHEQITMILEGKMDMMVGGVRKVVSKGDVVTIPTNIPHSAQILDSFTIAIDAWSPVRVDYK